MAAFARNLSIDAAAIGTLRVYTISAAQFQQLDWDIDYSSTQPSQDFLDSVGHQLQYYPKLS